jgi:hypothetical protein
MADTRITGYGAQTGAGTATGDLFETVDVSDTSMAATGTNKQITLAELILAIAARTSGSGGAGTKFFADDASMKPIDTSAIEGGAVVQYLARQFFK